MALDLRFLLHQCSQEDISASVCDIGFFRRYYQTLKSDDQDLIKKLVGRGQVDIVHGGIVSTDEACPDYTEILRNFEQAQIFLD